MSKILVIKHGALGDVMLATAPFQAIRKHHANDHITLLTTAPYAELLKTPGYFDEIWIDPRPRMSNPFAFFRLINRIRAGNFQRVYDLQTSERTSWYFRLMRGAKPEWVGTVKGASHRHDSPERTKLHTVMRHKQQMAVAGIADLPRPDISWLKTDVSHLRPTRPYAIIIPGGSSHRPGKRWPASHYAVLCEWLVARGVIPLLIGTEAESAVLSTIESICPQAVSLKGKTSFAELAELARHALFTLGNDTGPMHLAAVAGSPCLVLFSNASDPALCSPFGLNVHAMRREPLSDLPPEAVIREIGKWLPGLAAAS